MPGVIECVPYMAPRTGGDRVVALGAGVDPCSRPLFRDGRGVSVRCDRFHRRTD
jgi:hypothetical protein